MRQSVRPVGWPVASTAAAGRSSRGSGGSAPGAPQRFTRSAPHETQKRHDFLHISHAQKPRAGACRMWEQGAVRWGGLPRASGWLQPCAGGCLVHTSGGLHHATTLIPLQFLMLRSGITMLGTCLGADARAAAPTLGTSRWRLLATIAAALPQPLLHTTAVSRLTNPHTTSSMHFCTL